MQVRSEIENGTCVAIIDNPPVNAVVQAMRQGLSDAFDAATMYAGVEQGVAILFERVRQKGTP